MKSSQAHLFLRTLALAITLASSSPAREHAVVSGAVYEIDPMIGTISKRSDDDFYGLGKTFPGAVVPFGMVQFSPDTITGGDNASGYNYLHDSIEGFSLCHLSGTGWYGEWGNFQIMPTTGELEVDRDKARSPFRHEAESASAGYYSVHLDRYNIQAELSATQHAGIMRLTSPGKESMRIQVDLARRIGMKQRWIEHGHQVIEFLDDQTVQGWMECPHTDGGWGKGAGGVSYRLYFFAQFSQPFAKHGVWDKLQPMPNKSKYKGSNVGFYAEFETDAEEQVLMKVGISLVDLEGAKNNSAVEIPGWDFDATRQAARQRWAEILDLVEFKGGSQKDRTIMATALYHCFMDPRSIVDVDGRYRGADGEIRQSQGFTYRTVFSGWDAFRSHFPLLTLIRPDVIHDEINSWVELAQATGRDYLPRWEMMHSYSGCMLGNPAVSVVLDAYQKGIRTYDIDRVYELCKNSVERFGNHPRGFTPNSLSHTVEYAYSDWCVGRLAETLNKPAHARKYYHRSLAYRNLWDTEVRWLRGKDDDGNWLKWSKKTDYGQGCTESNPYQQAWFVPHDVSGLIELMGHEYFEEELIAFFEKAPDDLQWSDYYNHPNEPCHHVAFLFNYINKPWLTQKWTRALCSTAYGLGPYGLGGNEDLGQMSAWYVLAAAGLHPVCPGDGMYQLTSPVFDEVTLRLDPDFYSGSTLRIVAKKNSPENIYIQSVELNGKDLSRCWISHDEVVAGGTLIFEMGPSPNHQWGTAPPGSNLPETLR
ncbi:MAG: GH92 family glycosyl hydrolase [Lacipirellulaceae bacterium]